MEFIMRILRRAFWYVCKLLPLDKNKIVFVSYYGRGYSDNPKYIAEALIKKNAPLKYVWIAEDFENANTPDGFILAKMNSFKYIYHMSTAKFWVDNARKYWCLKRPEQVYIQCWHGGFGLKKIEKDAQNKLPEDYVRMAIRDAEQTDLMVSNSKTLTELYRNAFWYPEGEIMEKGLPRNDRLFAVTEDDVKRIKSSLNIENGVKLALYAPTFRENHSIEVYNMDYELFAKSLEEHFGGKWKILIRLHPNVFKLGAKMEFPKEYAINVSDYNDIQELYMISDLAVTDYSSVMFDFMLTKRPCLLYASDVEEYRKERDFFVTIDSLPFPLAQNNEELKDLVINFNENEYNKNVEKFKAYHGFCDDGNASNSIADWILDRIN